LLFTPDKGKEKKMQIRNATIHDLKAVAEVEALCFPEAEAASEEEFLERLTTYANHFWLLYDDSTLVGFLNGMVTEEETLTDEMYKDASLHNENGGWQMIFGVNTIPSYRRQGCASRLINQLIQDSKQQGRKGVVLTCKEQLLSYYGKFGFENEGISQSIHGNAVWYQMRLKFENTANKSEYINRNMEECL
jgi:ribosomal protein S18 acetylase RimI-like enzyme